jgi:hypothetical protein
MLCLLYLLERPGTHCPGGWVDHRAGLNSMEKLTLTGIGSPDCPAHIKALYQLHQPSWRCSFILLESCVILIWVVLLCYICLHRYLFKNGLQQEIMHFLWCLYSVYARHLPTDKLESNDFYFGMLGLNLSWDICQSWLNFSWFSWFSQTLFA